MAELTAEPIPHAYALIPDPKRPGYYYDVHLSQVYAENIELLEQSGRNSKAAFGLARINDAMAQRHRRRQWSK